MAIELQNIKHIFDENNQALLDINLKIEEGVIVAVAGKTGAGKSTLAEIIAGLTPPTSGNVLIDGVNIYKDKDGFKTMQKIGMVFQYSEYQLFEETVLKDISFAPKEMGFSESEVKEKVARAINLVELNNEILNRAPFSLSGGEKRKVAIAGILAFSPKYLILDEPTIGLDALGRNEILNLILKLNREEKTTIIFISHIMENIVEIAKKMIVMRDGKLLAYDDVYNIFNNEELLKNSGLTPPKISAFLKKLQNEGLDVKTDIVKFDEGINQIIKVLGD